jgi:hypothetical protein
MVDGYYGYNFKSSCWRHQSAASLRCSIKQFQFDQAAIVIERAPNLETGRRWGMRLDLQIRTGDRNGAGQRRE